ncbi:hypothetical protein B7Y92_01885 [Candidatus Saccharibacteria bacterium 32-50-13]|nr:MAG: hypothetical protein B7Y92_01885 [Candidatus Saccharibacteria bacterium 32-50-13]
MGLLDDLKAKADMSGDGKLSAEDLEQLKGTINGEQLDKLKQLADQNDDGKLDLNDIKGIDLGSIAGDVKDKLGGLFGK